METKAKRLHFYLTNILGVYLPSWGQGDDLVLNDMECALLYAEGAGSDTEEHYVERSLPNGT